MYFTKEDLEKIRKYISQYGVKDSEFAEQQSLGKKDWFTIVGSDGHNKRVNADILINLLRSLWKEIGSDSGIAFYGNRFTLSNAEDSTSVDLTLQIFEKLNNTDTITISLNKNGEPILSAQTVSPNVFKNNGSWIYTDTTSVESVYDITVLINDTPYTGQWRVEQGVALSQDYGDSTVLGISQKRLSDTLDSIWETLFNLQIISATFQASVQKFYVGERTPFRLTLSLPVPAAEMIIYAPNGQVLKRQQDVSTIYTDYIIEDDVTSNQQFTAQVRMAKTPKLYTLTLNADLHITSFTVSPQSVYVGEQTTFDISVTAARSMSMQISATLGEHTYSVQGMVKTDSISTTYTLNPNIVGTLVFTLTVSYQGVQTTWTKNIQVKQREYPYMYYGNSHNANPSEQEIKEMQNTRQSTVSNLLYNSTYFYIAVHSSKSLSAVHNVTELGPDNITEDVELVNNNFTITTSGPSQTYKLYRVKFNEDIAQYNQFDEYSLQITIS